MSEIYGLDAALKRLAARQQIMNAAAFRVEEEPSSDERSDDSTPRVPA